MTVGGEEVGGAVKAVLLMQVVLGWGTRQVVCIHMSKDSWAA